MKVPERDRDVRVLITKRVFGEYNSSYWVNKGTVLDGEIDENGNFQTTSTGDLITIYPTHFKILGKFYFRKSK